MSSISLFAPQEDRPSQGSFRIRIEGAETHRVEADEIEILRWRDSHIGVIDCALMMDGEERGG